MPNEGSIIIVVLTHHNPSSVKQQGEDIQNWEKLSWHGKIDLGSGLIVARGRTSSICRV